MAMIGNATPRVSILMCVRNAMPYLPAALDSILAQTYPRWELICIDDRSDDDTHDVLCAYGRSERRIVVLRATRNGLTPNLNVGLAQCSSSLIARMDGDDVMHPHRLEQQVREMDQRPALGVVGTAASVIDEAGVECGFIEVVTGPNAVRRALIRANPILHPSVMFRRDLIIQLGGYCERHEVAQDYDLWMRAARRADIDNLGSRLLQLRVHSQRTTERRTALQSRTHVSVQLDAIHRGWYSPLAYLYTIRPALHGVLPPSGARALMWWRRRRMRRKSVDCDG